MAAEISKRNKKYLLLFLLLLAFTILSGVLSPLLIENEKNGWDKTVIDKVELAENTINQSFDFKTNQLIAICKTVKKSLLPLISGTPLNKRPIFLLLNKEEYRDYSIQIYDQSDNLLSWNSEPVVENEKTEKLNALSGQSFFARQKLMTFLSFADSVISSSNRFFIIVSLPVEKHYSLSRSFYKSESAADSLSASLMTRIEINYSAAGEISRDGRKYSFPILNNFKNKIGVATFDKPALEAGINLIEKKIDLIQKLLFLLIFVLGSFWIRGYIFNQGRKLFRFLSASAVLITFRYLLFIFEIPSSFVHGPINDPSNFSSVFAFGMVRSPLEFFITVIFLLTVVLYGYHLTLDHYESVKTEKRNSQYGAPVIAAVLTFIYLLSLRGLGAAIRSVIFDSTIRYFKEFSLIPSPPILLMNFDILILGFCSVLFSVLLLVFVWLNLRSFAGKINGLKILFFLLIIQVAGLLFDILQAEPQGTPLIRIIYITLTFILWYIALFMNKKRGFIFLYYAFAASIITVALLTYYNSRIERESLKTTAHELTRTNEELIQFMVYQTLVQIQQNERAVNSFYERKNLSSDAFVLWTGSLLYREGIPSAINFFDSSKKFAGGYQTGRIVPFGTINTRLTEFPDSLKIFKDSDIYGDRVNFTGIAPLKDNGETIGYAVVSAVFDEKYLSDNELPKIFSTQRGGISSAMDFSKLKIYNFQNGALVHYYGDVRLSQEAIDTILGAHFSSYSEAWLNMKINNEENLIYLLKIKSNDSVKILAVAFEEKNFSWNLSDFFKVFFVHTVIIIFFALFFALLKFKNSRLIFASYRVRLIGAFLLISLLPLIIIALYFRDITEKKNTQLIEKRLSEMSDQVEFYINLYTSNKSLDRFLIYEKAARDLNINFSVYERSGLIFSTQGIYNEVGLLRSTINPLAYIECVLQRNRRMTSVEEIDNLPVNSVYSSVESGDRNIILRVDDLFNRVSVPLSDLELDIFLFGVFSLAVLLLFILSTVLADQISSPIRKLTLATKSVAGGDLNVEVNYKTTGEIKELVEGFNMMVKKIERSQFEIAQMERESAWKEMAKQVAHEIKNPLTPMKLNVQQLITAYRDKSPKFDLIFEKVTSTIVSQIETLKNIASEFSNFARMPRLNIERLNAAEVIQESLNLFAEEKREIKFVCSDQNIMINADHDQLRRTIINLIRNSLQAQSKNIAVSLKKVENLVYLSVTDDGKGIDAENINKVFDENFTTKKSGMGIGLSLARKFIEGIGGNISVVKSSGAGTEFLITLPLAE